jgi:predicted amidophosphoribosyltransferase
LPSFSRIDETNIQDHSRLRPEDEVYYLFEYTSGRNYAFSATNGLISNLKKPPSRSHLTEYRYKRRAITDCAGGLGGAINHRWLNGATLVPVPPSKARTDPEYDDRITQICRAIPASFALDVRELVIQRESTPAAHESDHRPTVRELLQIYGINEACASPAPLRIAIVDDVLTAGTHFRAVHTMLSERFPDTKIVGFFIARRVFPPGEVSVDTED